MKKSKTILVTVLVLVIIIGIIGYLYSKKGNVTTTSTVSSSDSKALLAEINQKGLQKFIDDHNISRDDVLFDKVCPLIETGQEEWMKIAADIRYGGVSTHDAGFNEIVDTCLGNALDNNPLAVLSVIKNHPQVISYRSRQDSSAVLDTKNTTAVAEIARICTRTNYDFDDSEPASGVYKKIIVELGKRKNSVDTVVAKNVTDVKDACLKTINSSIESFSAKLNK